jgi:uncharacterized RDD family membrane protein YckC
MFANISPREGIPAAGAVRCTLRRAMAPGRPLWRWTLFASVLFLIGGTVLAWTAETPGMRRFGIGVFVVSAAAYAAARIATTFGGRAR